MSELTDKLRERSYRFQFIWWWPRFYWPRYHKWSDAYHLPFLDYSIVFGPIEIRVWKKGMRPR